MRFIVVTVVVCFATASAMVLPRGTLPRAAVAPKMSLLKSAVEYFNYAVGFTNEFNGTGVFEGVQQKRAAGDERTMNIEPCPIPKELRRGNKRPEWTKRLPFNASSGGGSSNAAAVALIMMLALTSDAPPPASAFDNSLPLPETKSAPLPRKPGPAPTDIGIQSVDMGGTLKACVDTKPHCFSTASILEYDEFVYDAGVGDPGFIQPWTFTKSRAEAMQDVLAAINAYPPGQSGIDGGGWKILKQQPDYVYVQYESLLKGFKDDMEFAILSDGVLSMRTSSRIGRQDYLVNAKRVNYYAAALSDAGGWKTVAVDATTHPIYWTENTVPQGRAADMRTMRPDGSTR